MLTSKPAARSRRVSARRTSGSSSTTKTVPGRILMSHPSTPRDPLPGWPGHMGPKAHCRILVGKRLSAKVDSQGAIESTGSELRSPTSHVASGTGQYWFMSDTPGRLPRHGARRDSRAPLLGHSPDPPDFGTSRHATCLYLRPTPPAGPGATSVAAARRTTPARPPVPRPLRRSAAPVIGSRRERQYRPGPPG